MSHPRFLATLSLGLIAAACAGPYDRQAQVPYSPSRAATTSERNCLDYGFVAGSAPFDRCVQREATARASGRVHRDYAEARLIQDASDACSDYGLQRSTQRFDNCVAREVDARRYREQSDISTPPRTYAAITRRSARRPYVRRVSPRPVSWSPATNTASVTMTWATASTATAASSAHTAPDRRPPRPGRASNVARNNPAHHSGHRPAGRFQRPRRRLRLWLWTPLDGCPGPGGRRPSRLGPARQILSRQHNRNQETHMSTKR